MRWTLGIVAAFVVVLGANFVLAWAALTHDDEVVPSYRAEAR